MAIPSLRQKKLVKIKWALTHAFIERLKNTKFEQISIKDICEEVEISEASFYNYFPQKIDVIFYFAGLQIVKSLWILFYEKQHLNPIEKINFLFERFAKKMKHPYLFFEVISVISGQKVPLQTVEIANFEKKLLYPECEGIENIIIEPLNIVLQNLIKKAQEKKMIVSTIRPKQLTMILLSILVGTPLSLKIRDFGQLLNIYQLHLSIIWDQLSC